MEEVRMGDRRLEVPVAPSLLHRVLLDHSYGRAAGVKAATARREELEDAKEGGSVMDKKIEKNQIARRVKKESEDLEGEVGKMEDPVEVFLMEPKQEVDEETVDSEEDMLKDHCTDDLNCEEEEMKLATLMFRYTSLNCAKNDCRQKFKSKFSLLKHMSNEHGLTVYKCRERRCDAIFPLEGQLSAHKLNHSRVRQLNRQTSSLQFRLPHSLPHRCRVTGCGASYARMHHLRDHVKSQHKAGQGWD